MFNDLQFLKDRSWSGDFCCLKREVDGGRQFGFINKYSLMVNTGYIWDGGDGGQIKYNSYEEIVEDGWLVD